MLATMTDYDVIVVGLGAMGSAALHHLARRGRRVLGLEAFEPGHRLGSSHGESRIIRLAYYEHPNYVPLLRRAYELWADLERDCGEALLRISGGLMIGPPESELVSGARASAEQHGLEHEMLDAGEVMRRYPAFHLGSGDVGLWEPYAGLLRPEKCIEAHVRLAREGGAQTRYAEPVRDWRASSDGVEVTTDMSRYTAEQVVFTAGARISKLLGQAMPVVRAERVPLFWMEPSQPELFAPGACPIYMWEMPNAQGHFYGFPHVEWPGVKVARHHSRNFCDPDDVDRTTNVEDERQLREAITGRLPALDTRVVSSAVCLYENSPDAHFLIDRVNDYPNVIYAGGFSGHGFKFASVVGEILADLVTSGAATPDADFLRASRFAGSSVA
jgi:sarcosine oxidase